MKLSRILILAVAAASVATAASAHYEHHWGPQEHGHQYTYYTDMTKTTLVSINYMGCDGTETWDGFNGYPDLTLGEYGEYVDWDC